MGVTYRCFLFNRCCYLPLFFKKNDVVTHRCYLFTVFLPTVALFKKNDVVTYRWFLFKRCCYPPLFFKMVLLPTVVFCSNGVVTYRCLV